jgi:hypothetical protein
MPRGGKEERRMKSALFVTVALIATLCSSPSVHAATKACLTGTDPSVAADPMQIAAVRASVATQCPCASFDDSKGHTHLSYVKCAKGVIANAVTAGQLRMPCKATVTQYYSVSTCGLPANPPAAPCITESAAGKVKCAIKAMAKCKGTVCPNVTTCIDAADTNGDGLIGLGDDGACNVPAASPTPTATVAAASTPTPTPLPPGVPMQFTASLDGTQAGTTSTATGSCSATLDGTHTSLMIMCSHNVMNPTLAHIHNGPPSVAGPIVFPFASAASPINANWSSMMPADVANLMAGNLYVNIHSNNCAICPAGEIRGQLLPAP